MSLLADLRTRLSGPVAACVEAAKAAAERAMTRRAHNPEAGGPADPLPALPPAPAHDTQAALPLALRAPPPDTAPEPALSPAPAAETASDPMEDAHLHLARLSTALAASGDAAVAAAGAQFHGAVCTLLDALSRNPAALPAHIRPLSAWVPGLASATERYVSLQRQDPRTDRRDELLTVLEQVARRIGAHAQAVEGAAGSSRAA